MADRYEDDTPLTELVELMATRVDGVQSPANGAPGFLVIKAAAPASKARESQSSDHDVEAITGSAVPGATCNAPCADGSMCSRSPAAGSARCHHHQGVALTLKSKGTDMKATEALKQLHPDVSPETVERIVGNAAAMKGAVQDALGGTNTPEGGGTIASGMFGALRPATGGVNPSIRGNMTANGLPGMVGDLQGGESAYQIPAEGKVNGGEVESGQGGARAAILAALQGRSQQLQGNDANPQLAAKAKALEALAEVAAAQRAVKAADGQHPQVVERAGEQLTRAALRLEAIARFGA